jgi:hypothetical protein
LDKKCLFNKIIYFKRMYKKKLLHRKGDAAIHRDSIPLLIYSSQKDSQQISAKMS